MNVKIRSVSLENFKGARNVHCNFDSKNVTVSGANATGKTTIFDAVWWVLFNKDSLGNERFSIRPLDENGQPIHNLEIKVTLVLDVDGREMELCKTQKEKWVKRRGSESSELQGNENLYTIDGYPKTEKDYKLAIADLVSEDVFKMLTSPTYFTNLKWKEQRDILMRFVSQVHDYDLANSEPLFAPLLSELAKAPGLDDIRAKYQKALTEWKRKQAEIPVRIDEAQKSKTSVDVAELELGKKAVQELIKSNQLKLESANEQYKTQSEISDGILELKFQLGDLDRKANADLIKKRRDLHEEIESLEYNMKLKRGSVADINLSINGLKKQIEKNREEINVQRDKWKEESNSVFDDSSLFCPYCKQDYPEDKKEYLRAEFESQKAKQLELITERGNELKKQIESDMSTWSDLQNKLNKTEEFISDMEKEVSSMKKQLSELPTSIDVSQTEEYKEINEKILEKEAAMQKFNSADSIRRELTEESVKLQMQLTEFERQIALAQRNVEIDERIAELQNEQREIGQNVVAQEKMLYLLEEFIRFKMDRVSAEINGKFDGINFKLFENLLNGGLKETCECTVNGVNYASLNNGHRIVAGLQIIKALQKLYGVQMPIFTDNAEAINDFNLPQMDNQLILLKVSDDKVLSIVKEEQ